MESQAIIFDLNDLTNLTDRLISSDFALGSKADVSGNLNKAGSAELYVIYQWFCFAEKPCLL